MRFVKTLPFLFTLGATFGSAAAWALPTDRTQPIRVQADSAELDDKQGVAVYRGDVVITQGSMKITGNTVTGGYPIDIFVRNNSAGSTFRLPGYAGSGTDLTAVQNFILTNNTVTTVLAQRKTTIPANQYTGGAACPTPAP